MAETTIGINGLQPGFKYNVRVRGIFNGVPGQWSATEEVDVFSTTTGGTGDKAPSAVGNFTVTPTVDSFILTWDAPTTNADATTLTDMKDYVIEVRNDSQVGTLDASYTLPEHQKPIDLSATDRAKTFEFTYKMNKELYGGSGQPVLYFKVYARDTTNNRSAAAQATGTNSAPSAPTSLTATAVVGGANVTWGGGTSNDIVAYTLKYSTSNGFDPTSTGTEAYRGPLTNFSFSGTAGTTYYFRVGSVDIFGQVAWYSTQASATPTGGSISYSTPTAPTSLVDSWVGANYRISWTASTTPAVTDIDRYKVEVTANAVTKTYWTTGVFYDIDPEVGKDFGTAWPYTPTQINVYAVGPSGLTSSALAKSASFAAAPSTPAAPTLTSTLSSEGVVLTWSAPSDPNGIIRQIEVYASTASTASPTKAVYSGKGTSFTHALSPTFSGTYYYKSRVLDVFNRYSSYSAEDSESVTSVGVPTALSMSTALDPADSSNLTALVTVNWTTPSSLIYGGSKIRYRIGAGVYTEVDVGKMGGPSTAVSYNLRNLATNTSYEVQVASYDFNGTIGTWTNADADGLITTAVDSTAPSAALSPAASVGATSLVVTWTGETAGDVIVNNGRYDIEIATDSGFSANVRRQTQPGGVSGQTHSASFTGLTPGTAYFARVRAADATGNLGSWNNVGAPTSVTIGTSVVIKDGVAPSSSPSLAAAGSVISGINGIHVRWSAVSNNNPVTYEVHVGTASGFTPSGSTKVGEIDGTYMFVKTDGAGTALSYATNYYFKIIAKDADGSAAAGTVSSAVQLAKVDGAADITALSITAASIAADAIIASKILAGEITTNHINTSGINADKINIGGNATNMVPTEYADFEATSTLYGSGQAFALTAVGAPTGLGTSATQAKFGTRSATVTLNLANQGFYIAPSATTYNIPFQAGKSYIVSAYVYSSSSQNIQFQFKNSGGGPTNITMNAAAVTAGSWQRVYGLYTPGADVVNNFNITFSGTTGTQYVDGFMIEEQVGKLTTPSAFVKPSTIIDGAQIVTGSMNADRITAASITATQIASSAITADKIGAGEVASTKFFSGTLASNLLSNPAFEQVGSGSPAAGIYGDNEAFPGWTFGRTSPDATSFYGVEYLTGGVTPRAGLAKLRLDCIASQAGTYAVSDPIPVVVGNTYRVGGYVSGDINSRVTMKVETAGASTGPWTEQTISPPWDSFIPPTGEEPAAIFTDTGDQVFVSGPSEPSWAVTFTDTGDLVNIPTTYDVNPFEDGDAVYFSTITSTTGISTNTRYYVVNAKPTTFQVSTSLGGAAVALTTDGSGTVSELTIATTAASNLFTMKDGHEFKNDDAIAFKLITQTTGISTNTRYYVINATSSTFQVSTSIGGAAVTLTTNGFAAPYARPHGYSNDDPIMFKTITSTTGISTNTRYYVVNATSTTLQVASTVGGSAIALTTNGTGVVYAKPDMSISKPLKANYTPTSGQTWMRIKFKNVGSSITSSAFVDDAWVMQNGYGSVELTGAGLRMWDRGGEETISLLGEPVGGGSFLQIRNNGETMASIGADGVAAFQRIQVEEDIEIKGEDLEVFLDRRGRGIVAFGIRGTDSNLIGTGEDVYLEVDASLEKNRTYKIHTSNFVCGNPGSGNAGTIYLRYTNNSTKPNNTSTILGREKYGYTVSGVDGRPTVKFNKIYRLSGNKGEYEDFRVVVSHTGSAANSSQILGSLDPVQLWIEDIGPYVEDAGIDRNTDTTTDTWKVYTKTYPAQWSAIYDGSGNKLAGENDSLFVTANSGLDYKSAFGFDSGKIQGDLANATVLSVDLYLYCHATYNNGGHTAVIGEHESGSESSTWAGLTNKNPDLKRVTSWRAGVGKWVPLGDTSFSYTGWKNGGIKGILLGPAPGSSTDWSAYYRGVAHAKKPVLRIKYKTKV